MTTPNYDIDYKDSRFTEVEADKTAALNSVDVTYGNMISQSDQYYNKQIQAAQNYANTQSAIQQQQTDFAIQQINQQKAQAAQDYTKEQSGAYVDWQKQSNQYGANAEAMAAQGMQNTGFSESSQVSMYNTYQNRVATARESYNRAVLNYDNAIKDARLQNNAALAEIAYNALQTQLELSLQGFQYKNNLLIEQANKKLEVENTYYNRYQDVLDQINKENTLAENVRQHNEEMEYKTTQAELEREFEQKQAELDRQHDKDMLEAKTKAEKELIEKEYAEKKAYLAEELESEKEILEHQASITPDKTPDKTGSSSSSSDKSWKNKPTIKQVDASGSGNNGLNAQGTNANINDAEKYINALIASGAPKDEVANKISIALREGALTKKEAQELRNSFTPRGVQY